MTESYLYLLSQRIRLLARANVRLDQDGRILAGAVDPELEAIRSDLNEMLDQVLDGHQVNDFQRRFIRQVEAVIAANRPLVKQLELEFQPFAS